MKKMKIPAPTCRLRSACKQYSSGGFNDPNDFREAVERMNKVAGDNGGTSDINPMQDHGSMCSRAFADPDGHVWEPMWMDPAAIPSSESSS